MEFWRVGNGTLHKLVRIAKNRSRNFNFAVAIDVSDHRCDPCSGLRACLHERRDGFLPEGMFAGLDFCRRACLPDGIFVFPLKVFSYQNVITQIYTVITQNCTVWD